MLSDEKILITGPAGRVAFGLAKQLAKDNEVWGVARFGDPAARSVDEVLLCYPGVLAIIHHRLAHTLYQLGTPLLARRAQPARPSERSACSASFAGSSA